MRCPYILALVAFALPAIAAGQQFRSETEVFRGDEEKPFVRTLTLFTEDVVYDFQLTSDEITVFDPNRNRFVLLNVKDEVKTTLSTHDVLTAVSKVKAQIPGDNKLFHFAANPEFEATDNQEESTIEFASHPMTYTVKGILPQKKDLAQRYQGFADWSARLNSLTGHLPPFARMDVNQGVADQGWLPADVKVVLRYKNGFFTREAYIRSTHEYKWTLSNTDQKRITKVGDYMASFTELPYVEYIDGGKEVAVK